MKTESHFTAKEIAAARHYGAAVTPLKFNRYCLDFPSQQAYEQWMEEQKRESPLVWMNSFSILQKTALPV
jgi:hypothetical protein